MDEAALKDTRLVGRAAALGREQPLGLPLASIVSPPDVSVSVQPPRLSLQPGSRVVATVTIQRHNGFADRVPIEIRNLPYGVKVMDIGLNGVLITELMRLPG